MENHRILSLTDTCTGCFACANACPKEAIQLPENEEGFYFPSIDPSRCVDCGLCDRVCPQLAPRPLHTTRRAYYGWAEDDALRRSSSSGGMFSMLADGVIREGGVVYGSCFSYDGLLRLECNSTRRVTLAELRRSKYVQSRIGMAYRNVRQDLRSGVPVLFCGTPCQADGLLAYLGGHPDGLLVVDFVCHGVPSMDMLRRHLEYRGLDGVTDICFRPKVRAWVDDIRVTYRGGRKVYQRPWQFDEFFKMFMDYRNLRRSCHQCRYCNGQRAADISLADFWGVDKFDPSLHDVRGLSLACANTPSGISAMERLAGRDGFVVRPLDTKYTEYLYSRKRTEPSSKYNFPGRDGFFADVRTMGYAAALGKHGFRVDESAYRAYRLKSLVKRLLRMFGG